MASTPTQAYTSTVILVDGETGGISRTTHRRKYASDAEAIEDVTTRAELDADAFDCTLASVTVRRGPTIRDSVVIN